jgi:transcriptional regulator with XRE-family HTH domain
MATEHLGIYLRILRKHKKLSQDKLGALVGVKSPQIFRIEQGEGDVRASLVAAVSNALEASPHDVIFLLVDPSVTVEQAESMANRWINRDVSVSEVLKDHPEIAYIASQMSDYQLGKWAAAGENILKG